MKNLQLTSQYHHFNPLKLTAIMLHISVWAVTLTSCKEDEPKTVEVPFKAEFYSVPAEDAFQENCFPPTSERDFWGKDHQIGEGTATELGKVKFDSYFCFHVVLDENGNPVFDNGFGEYKDEGLEGYFEAANGDRLFLATPEGLVFPSDKSGYRLEFHDITYITGGTGRFEGASGELQSNGFVGETQTDHEWEGTLILPKGN